MGGAFVSIALSLKTDCLWTQQQEVITRSDILQGQALFRGVKKLRRCLVMLNNFENFPLFPIKEKDGQKTKRQTEKRKKEKKEKRIKERKKIRK